VEYFDVYDANGNYLNKQVPRGTKLSDGEYFLVIHVWIQNSDGNFLIQKRAKTDDPIPHQWAIISGIPSSQEGPVKAAIRETYEEIGLTLSPKELTRFRRIVSDHNRYHTITHVYHVTRDVDLHGLTLNEEEVMAVQYASLETILSMVERKAFWDYEALLDDPGYFDHLRGRD